MTILNLNGPAGREPRSKKTVRAWMGVGLVIAVLGLGSTFAANISIANNDESEFGQGVTKTVYCGAEEDEITITPVSAFVNERSTVIPGVAAVPSRWTEPTFSGRSFVRVSSSSSVGEGTYVNDSSGASETKVKGYWISSRTNSNPTVSSNGNSSGSNTVFVPQVRDNGDYGFYKYSSWTPGSWSTAVAAVASRTNTIPKNFELKGITVSDIDSECDGRDFVISAYGGSGDTPLPLVNNYEEIAVLYEDVNSPKDAIFSFDRTGLSSNPDNYANVINDRKKFAITFTGTGRIDADDLKNIVIETQDDLLGNDNDEEEDD
jgi:hypothetical protein